MEPLPSKTSFMTTLGCDSDVEDNSTCLEQFIDLWWQNSFLDKQILPTEVFFTSAKDPPGLPPGDPPAFLSQQVSKLAVPLCSTFNSTGVAASEGIEAVFAGSSRPALDLKDPDYGGENGPETRPQSLEVASPLNTSALLRSCQFISDDAEAARRINPVIPASLGGEITEYSPTFRASYCHPELGDPKPSILRNAFRTELSRGNSTDTNYNTKYNACAKGPKRGHRGPNWTDEEKDAFLEVKVEAQTAVKGKDWEFISIALKDRYAFERSAKSCEDLWGTLQKSFKVIGQHESMNHSNNWCSYWDLDENGRSKLQLPKSFSFRWYKMIESICAGKGKLAARDRHQHVRKTIESICGVQGKRSAGDQHWHKTLESICALHKTLESTCAGYKTIESTCGEQVKRPGGDQHWHKTIESTCAGKEKRAAGDQQTWTTKDPGLTSLEGVGECSSLLRLADGLKNPQRDVPETSTFNTLTMSKEGLGPYLQNVVIDALQSALKPLATILQCEDQEKQEFDARMKALEKKRRALDLEEIQIKRQRLGQYQRTRGSTCRPQQQDGLPVTKTSVKKIIPAFKEMNLAVAEEGIELHDSN